MKTYMHNFGDQGNPIPVELFLQFSATYMETEEEEEEEEDETMVTNSNSSDWEIKNFEKINDYGFS